jgi:hypothetical protein
VERGILESRVNPSSKRTNVFEYRFKGSGVKALEKLLASS